MNRSTLQVRARPEGVQARHRGVLGALWAVCLACLGFARRKPLGAAGAAITIGLVLAAISADVITPYGPYELHLREKLASPSARYWLGSDELGRDIFTRIVYGARTSLYVGLLSVAVGNSIGLVLGLLSGYLGGKVDHLIMRGVDVMMALPLLIFALVIVAVMGASLNNVVIALAITKIPGAVRVVRSAALGVKPSQFVEAARAVGCGDLRIIRVHILPNTMAPFIVLATAGVASAILAEASLSFLGLGTPPPIPSWGAMVSGPGREFIERSVFLSLFPGLALALVVFGLNLFGDALRDVWDPRLRGS